MKQYSIRTLLLATAVVAVLISVYSINKNNKLWRNTRFNCDYDAIVTLPSGTKFWTNTWTTTDIGIPTAHTGTGVWLEGRELLYFNQSPGMKRFATLTVDGKTTNAVVLKWSMTCYASKGMTEYTCTVVPETEMPSDDGTRP
ncbi:hypothetical protein Q31b_58900 [Novipirellula aureliae]|uniref:Uncharacterized protein n=1 Tax=Novipirellula aureliae TaxID=2527966 RepID=A0A5C6D2X9_9BACT|nr:hypothetical protein [Novipirellula aureliae]TWU31098.1 hypothetical protein Q31b_58900 [Novipirellula aureliae]